MLSQPVLPQRQRQALELSSEVEAPQDEVEAHQTASKPEELDVKPRQVSS